MSLVGAVTGRQYTKTRARGFAPWNPAAATLTIIEQVKEIITEYSIALTIRQIFYRLVGKYQYEKTERAYDRLGEYLSRARRAGLIKLNAIRDDGDIVPSIPGWESPGDLWDTVRILAQHYFRTPAGDSYVEVGRDRRHGSADSSRCGSVRRESYRRRRIRFGNGQDQRRGSPAGY